MNNRELANNLVTIYGARLGVSNAVLDEENDRSFGDVGLHYYPARGILTGRVLIVTRSASRVTPESEERALTAMAELNTERVLPYFERAGGYFDYEEQKRMLFLKKDFVVESVTGQDLVAQMDELRDVGAKWEFRWLRWAMAIIYGQAPPPDPPIPVTRLNDAQHREYRR